MGSSEPCWPGPSVSCSGRGAKLPRRRADLDHRDHHHLRSRVGESERQRQAGRQNVLIVDAAVHFIDLRLRVFAFIRAALLKRGGETLVAVIVPGGTLEAVPATFAPALLPVRLRVFAGLAEAHGWPEPGLDGENAGAVRGRGIEQRLRGRHALEESFPCGPAGGAGDQPEQEDRGAEPHGGGNAAGCFRAVGAERREPRDGEGRRGLHDHSSADLPGAVQYLARTRSASAAGPRPPGPADFPPAAGPSGAFFA